MRITIIIFLQFIIQSGFSQNIYELKNDLDSLDVLKIESSQIKKYVSLKEKCNKYQQTFITELLKNINDYNNSKFYNEYLTIGNIDGVDDLDTIKTIIYVKNKIVYLKSEWFKNKKLMWSHSIKNPYKEIMDDSLFSYENSDIWVRITIAKDYTIPTLKPKSDSEYSKITQDALVKAGVFDLKRKKIIVSESQYLTYIKNFNGSVLQYGEPEASNLIIWYKPFNMFVDFYSP